MNKELKDLEVGDKVWEGGDSGFCYDSISRVKKISFKYDEDTGEQYKRIHLENKDDYRVYDSRTGFPLFTPKAYYIKSTDQDYKCTYE